MSTQIQNGFCLFCLIVFWVVTDVAFDTTDSPHGLFFPSCGCVGKPLLLPIIIDLKLNTHFEIAAVVLLCESTDFKYWLIFPIGILEYSKRIPWSSAFADRESVS